MPPTAVAELPALDPNRLYLPREAAAYLAQSRSQVYKDLKAGRIRAVDHNGLKIPGREIARIANGAAA